MTDMSIEDYLAHGGKLTSPGNVPARYRGELLRLMASFVDSELAASAGFADSINDAPGIKSRIAAAKITLEKADHADRVLRLMAEFGVDTERYEDVHPWADRLARDADIGATRQEGDMRTLPAGWTAQFDAVLNMFSAFGYFDEAADNQQVLAEVARVLRPGGIFILDLAQRDAVVHNFRPTDWFEVDDLLVCVSRQFDAITGNSTEYWLWSDEQRTLRLGRIYNDEYNVYAPRKPDGSHLELPGSNPLIQLRPHQKNAVWRNITTGNTLFAHVVGAGKTFAAIAAAMEMKRLGLVRKPMFVVPNPPKPPPSAFGR